MIPGLVRLPLPEDARGGDRSALAVPRRREGALGRPEPAAAPEAAAGLRRAPRRHRPDPGPRVHQGGRRVPEDRRPDARGGARGARISSSKKYPILADTAAVIADPLVRNLATVGGNLAHGDPANDHPATMLALGATVVATGPKGERTIPIDEFFTGLFATALAPDEILTEIRIPTPPARSRAAPTSSSSARSATSRRRPRRRSSRSARAARSRGPASALTNAGPTPVEATAAEKFLQGKKPDAAAIAEAAQLAAQAAQPEADRRGTVEYKTGDGARAHGAGAEARRRAGAEQGA